ISGRSLVQLARQWRQGARARSQWLRAWMARCRRCGLGWGRYGQLQLPELLADRVFRAAHHSADEHRAEPVGAELAQQLALLVGPGDGDDVLHAGWHGMVSHGFKEAAAWTTIGWRSQRRTVTRGISASAADLPRAASQCPP